MQVGITIFQIMKNIVLLSAKVTARGEIKQNDQTNYYNSSPKSRKVVNQRLTQ